MACPNLSDPKVVAQFGELVEVVGENLAHYIWDRNNGNPIDKTPSGDHSTLFNEILSLPEVRGNREKAIAIKAGAYKNSFMDWHGDWTTNYQEEPTIEYKEDHPLFINEKGEVNSIFNFEGFVEDLKDVYNKEDTHPYAIDHNYFFHRLYNEGIIGYQPTTKNAPGRVRIHDASLIDGRWINTLDRKIERIEALNEEFIQYTGEPIIEYEGTYLSLNRVAFTALKKSEEYESRFVEPPSEALKTVLSKLQSQFNIPYIVIRDTTVEWGGKFDNGTVIINTANMTEDTPFHEYAHPFIEVLEDQNPALYEELKKQILTTKEGRAELRRIQGSSFYRESTPNDQMKEAIVSLLGKYAADTNFTTNKDLKYYLDLLFKRMVEYFKSITSPEGTVDISKIDSKISLRELSTLFNSDLAFDVSDGMEGEFFQVATEEQEINLEALGEFNDSLLASLRSREEDLNLIITEDSNDIKKENARIELRSLREKVKHLDEKDTFIELTSKAIKDLVAIHTWMEDKANFEKQDSNTERRLNLINTYLKTYDGIVDTLGIVESDPLLKDAVNKVNKYLRGINNLRYGTLLDYLTNVVNESTTNPERKNNTELIRAILQEQEDLGNQDYVLGNLSSSKNPLFTLIDKEFKKKLDIIHKDNLDVKDGATEIIDNLIELSGGSPDTAYDFMIIKEEGKTIDKIRNSYDNKLNSMYEGMLDENDDQMEYHTITANEVGLASKEELDFNKELAEKKEEHREFMKAEITTADGYTDGENHRYTEEFKIARSQHQRYDPASRQWVPLDKYRASMIALDDSSTPPNHIEGHKQIVKEYTRFLNTFYSSPIDYWTIDRAYNKETKKREVTGAVKWVEDSRFVNEEFIETRDMWNSDKYKEIQNPTTELGKAQKAFYNMYNDLFIEANNKIPSSISNNMKGRIPHQLKHVFDRMSESESKLKFIGSQMKERFGTSEVYLNQRALDEEGNVRKGVPIFYTNSLQSQRKIDKLKGALLELDEVKDKKEYDKLNRKLKAEESKATPSDLSTNLGAAILSYSNMANKFQVLQEFEPMVNLVKDVVSKAKYLKKGTSGRIEQIFSNIKDSTGAHKEGVSRTEKRYDAWVKSVFYDHPEYDETVMGTVSKEAMKYTSMRNLGLNVFSNMNNLLIGGIFQQIEVIGGQYFAYSNYLKANKEFAKYLSSDIWKDLNGTFKNGKMVGNTQPQSKMTAFDNEWKIVSDQSEAFTRSQKNDTFLKKLWSGNFAYVGMHMGEFANQMRTAVAVMMDEKIKKDGKEYTLWEAHYKDKKGRFVLRDGFEFSADEKSRVQRKIIAINQEIHGVYTKEDQALMQNFWAGRLAMHFKKWVGKFFDTRFKKRYYNEAIGVDLEGRYLTLATIMNNLYGMLAKGDKWNTLDDTQRANLYKNAMELGYLVSAIALYYATAAIAEGVDDDDETLKKLANWLHYQDSRIISELTLVLNPVEFYDNFKNPIATQNMVREAGNLLLELTKVPYYNITGETEKLYYKRGEFQGESKVGRRLKKVGAYTYIWDKWRSFGEDREYKIRS